MKKHYITVITSVLSAIIGVFIYVQLSPKVITKVIEREVVYSKTVALNDSGSSTMMDFVIPSKIARPTVVHIKSKTLTSKSLFTPKYIVNNGSGVIISHDGYIITNCHVIGEANIIEVILDDNRAFKAKVIGKDVMTDLALLRIEAEGLKFLSFGDSDELNVGEWVLAIGNPFKLQSTITAGIVSAKARNINLLMDAGVESFIQTDAAVNPGNSGGALVDKDAKLVGINTAILSEKGSYEGFSFAIPSNLVKKIINDIMTYGAVQRAWLGVSIRDVDSELAKFYGMEVPKGVYVDIVHKKGAAEDAGLVATDIILSIDGTKTNSDAQFSGKISQYHPGAKVRVKILRKGNEKTVKVILKNQINSTDLVAVRKDRVLQELGFELRDLDQLEQDRLSSSGVKVISIYKESVVGRSNMEVGYVIQSINGKPIVTVNELIAILKKDHEIIEMVGVYENYPGIYPYSFNLK